MTELFSSDTDLSERELKRYERQLILSSWTLEKQLSLRNQRVLISANLPSTALYLAAAGVGSIAIFGEAQSRDALAQQIREQNSDISCSSADAELPEPLDCCIALRSEKHLLEGVWTSKREILLDDGTDSLDLLILGTQAALDYLDKGILS